MALMRTRLGLPDGPLAVCVASFTGTKNQRLLVEAWPKVTARLPSAQLVFVGDGPLLAAVEERCAAGWPQGSLHLERFAARPADKPARERGFEVELRRSGRTLAVAADESLFDVVRDAGISVLGSCLEGICGTCETQVLDGEVDHRDSVLDDEERAANDCMMICVSRGRSERLVLDL